MSPENASCPLGPAELARRLEHFAGGEIDVEAWTRFLDAHLADKAQDDAGRVCQVWAEWLVRRFPLEYGKRPPAPAPSPQPLRVFPAAEADAPPVPPASPSELRILARRLWWQEPGDVDLNTWEAYLAGLAPPDGEDAEAWVWRAWAEFAADSPQPAEEQPLPGTDVKVELMRDRAVWGQPLFRPDDPVWEGPAAPEMEAKRGGRTGEGVGVTRARRKFRARLWEAGEYRSLGLFATEAEAAAAVREAKERPAA